MDVCGWDIMLTTYICIVLSLRMGGTMPPLSLMPLWHMLGQLYISLYQSQAMSASVLQSEFRYPTLK